MEKYRELTEAAIKSGEFDGAMASDRRPAKLTRKTDKCRLFNRMVDVCVNDCQSCTLSKPAYGKNRARAEGRINRTRAGSFAP